MNVEATEPGRVQHLPRQDQPVGDDDGGVQPQRGEGRVLLGPPAQAVGVADR